MKPKERFELVQIVSQLPAAQFEQLVFALNPPAGIISPSSAAQGGRTAELLQWTEGLTGPGLETLIEVLQDVLGTDIFLGRPSSQRDKHQETVSREPSTILAEGVQVWNEWRADNPTVTPNLHSIDLRNLDLTEVNFFSVDLSSANLSAAVLKNADLRGSKLVGATLSHANLLEANLRNANLIRADFYEANLRDTDLRDTDLSQANLRDSNLRASQVLGASFKQADLTGACIEDWQLGTSTRLQQVRCEYIFRQYDPDTHQFLGRLPVNPDTNFTSEEFEQWIKVRLAALDTIDITFTEGIDWRSLFTSLQRVRQQYSNSHISMQSVGESEGIYVVRLKVETEETGEALKQLKAKIETQTKNFYQRQLTEAQGEIKALERSLDKALEKLAMASGDNSTNMNFYGPTGNVSGTNYGSMTTYINQNSDEIARLLSVLREKAQSFPEEQKEETLMELDDLESDLQAPEKQDPKRLGKRLKRLMAAGTAAVAISGSAATAAGHLNEFTTNVLELGEKIGFRQENGI